MRRTPELDRTAHLPRAGSRASPTSRPATQTRRIRVSFGNVWQRVRAERARLVAVALPERPPSGSLPSQIGLGRAQAGNAKPPPDTELGQEARGP